MLIINAILHVGNGQVLESASVEIEGGKIVSVTAGSEFSHSGEDVFDVRGAHLFPGFVDAVNAYGVTGPGWRDDDASELSDPLHPELLISDSFDHEGLLFQRLYEYGTTCVGLAPGIKSILGGKASVYRTFGRHPLKMDILKDAYMMGSVTEEVRKHFGKKTRRPMTKMGIYALLADLNAKTDSYKKKEEKDFDMKLEAYSGVLDGSIRLIVNSNTKLDHERVKILFEGRDVDLVFSGSYDLIEGDDQPVFLGDRTMAMNPHAVSIDYKLVGRELERGRLVAISNSGDVLASGKESLLWNAGFAYHGGIPSEKVLEMITRIPAEIIGVSDFVGTIEVGKYADMSIWTENPIESFKAKPIKVFIQGEDVLGNEEALKCW